MNFVQEMRRHMAQLEHDAEQHVARIEALTKFVRDIAAHGLSADLSPTMDSRGDMYGQWSAYLRRIDAELRERARSRLLAAQAWSGGSTPQGSRRAQTHSPGNVADEALKDAGLLAPEPPTAHFKKLDESTEELVYCTRCGAVLAWSFALRHFNDVHRPPT